MAVQGGGLLVDVGRHLISSRWLTGDKMRNFIFAFLALLSIAVSTSTRAEPTEKRIALVIGNGSYQTGALPTAANDAGLIAQTLQAAGFDVVGARDLDDDSLRHAFRDFLDKASASGSDAVAFVYFAGYGLQLEGDNYLVPVDANITRSTDVASKTMRVSDYTRSLAALRLKATIVVLDAARASPFTVSDQPLAGGLALVEPDPGMLIAFNAAPSTVAPEAQSGYGPYAKSLAEMMRDAGVTLVELFDRVRLRVNEVTKGTQVPWDSSKIDVPFVFFERTAEAPVPLASVQETSDLRTRSIRDLDAQSAYLAALERDTVEGYEEFLAAYPRDPMARRVRAIIAARREAITWRRTYATDTPDAYWSYLRRYPRGPHAADARRRLAQLSAELEPPPTFAEVDYDLPPPPPEEIEYVDRPVLAFYDPIFAFAPPPPPPDDYLPPPPPEFVALEPPLPPVGIFLLPVPVFVPVPVWTEPPAYVAPPPNNVIFTNIHNTVIVNNTTNVVTIKNQSGQVVSTGPRDSAPPGTAAQAATVGPALPPTIAHKAALLPPDAARAPGPPPTLTPREPLPGTGGHPLPPLNEKSGTRPTLNAPTTPPPSGPRRPPGAPGQPPAPAAATAHTTPPAAGIEAPPGGGHKLPSVPATSHGLHGPNPPPAAHTSVPPTGARANAPPTCAPIHTPSPASGGHRPPPPPAATGHHPPQPPAAHVSPPRPAVHVSPPPATAHRPPPPASHTPPPAAAYHPASAPAYRPPPPAAHAPPPAAAYHSAPPPAYHLPAPAFHPPPAAAARPAPAPPQAAHGCQVVAGHQVCH